MDATTIYFTGIIMAAYLHITLIINIFYSRMVAYSTIAVVWRRFPMQVCLVLVLYR